MEDFEKVISLLEKIADSSERVAASNEKVVESMLVAHQSTIKANAAIEAIETLRLEREKLIMAREQEMWAIDRAREAEYAAALRIAKNG